MVAVAVFVGKTSHISDSIDSNTADLRAEIDKRIASVNARAALSPEFGDIPDFVSLQDVRELKETFYDYLDPIVNFHNEIITEQRSLLFEISTHYEAGLPLTHIEQQFIVELAREYELRWSDELALETLAGLRRRVDVIPLALVEVQAAKESGWGRSRFAIQANNLFGQWCYSAGCGLIPTFRPEGASYEVRKYESVSESVESYLNNLNTNPSYQALRFIREEMRLESKQLSGVALADGLLFYSERREAYVEEVKNMLAQYHQFQSERTL